MPLQSKKEHATAQRMKKGVSTMCNIDVYAQDDNAKGELKMMAEGVV